MEKPLYLLKHGDKFTHNNETYTVYTHEGNMTEVLKNGEFWAWPNWNGRCNTIVTLIHYGSKDHTQQHIGAPIREAA